MLIEFSYAQQYLFTALESAPGLFDHLLQNLTPVEADLKPDPERFSIREIMAHLAEWDVILLERMQRVCVEEHPMLPGYDEGELALSSNYSATDVREQLQLFRERRAQMVEFLRSRHPDEWQRTANRPEIGVVTLEALALLVPLHDTYHLAQIAQWRQSVG